MSPGTELDAFLAAWRPRVDEMLGALLPEASGPAGRLAEAMRYATLAPGKRLRPLLCIASWSSCGGSGDPPLAPAAALEMIHAYSLVHDDLPAMDDDDLRRGRPTVHRAFDEATAILAGDALQCLAFEVLACHPEGEAHAARRAPAVAAVARRAGFEGMVGGQTADLGAEGLPPDAERVGWIHRRKTADLLTAACEVGAIHAGAGPEETAALVDYGQALGLAFQIADDVLDRVGDAASLGKTPGKDDAADKATFPALYGIDASREMADEQAEAAVAALARLGRPAPLLEALARASARRDH